MRKKNNVHKWLVHMNAQDRWEMLLRMLTPPFKVVMSLIGLLVLFGFVELLRQLYWLKLLPLE